MPEKRKAISKINKNGILIVFPVNNHPEPHSLWTQFFPKTKMKWEWDGDGDAKVAGLWRLMKTLSDCRDVVYSKWYQGRATFFSRDLFMALLRNFTFEIDGNLVLSANAQNMLEVLEIDSPLSTRELKKRTELQGKVNEPNYNRGVKDLFSTFLAVGFGEVDDGAFPSLALGATHLLYEEIWKEAEKISSEDALSIIDKYMPQDSLVRRYLEKMRSAFISKSSST